MHASPFHPKPPKKTVVLRCPEELQKKVGELCRLNGMDRSGLLVAALHSFLRRAAEEGDVAPLPKPKLPPAPRKTQLLDEHRTKQRFTHL